MSRGIQGVARDQVIWLVGGVADCYDDEKIAAQAVEKIIRREMRPQQNTAKGQAIALLLEHGNVTAALELFNEIAEQPLVFTCTQLRAAGPTIDDE